MSASVVEGALPAISSAGTGLIEFLIVPTGLETAYIRGNAQLAAGQGSSAAAEFQKILDHNGLVWNCGAGALAHLGVARANAPQAKNSTGADAGAARIRALASYKDFLTLWKSADPDIPILPAGQGRVRGVAIANSSRPLRQCALVGSVR